LLLNLVITLKIIETLVWAFELAGVVDALVGVPARDEVAFKMRSSPHDIGFGEIMGELPLELT
jgi:hypothetical protein